MPPNRRYGPEFPPELTLYNQLEDARAKLNAIREALDSRSGNLAEEIRAILGEPWKPVEVDETFLNERRKEWNL